MFNKVILSIFLVLLSISVPSVMIAQQHNESVESTDIYGSDETFDDESFFDFEEDFKQEPAIQKPSKVTFWLKRFGLRILLLYEDTVLACKRILSR